MQKFLALAAVGLLMVATGCKKSEHEVVTPDVNVSADTDTVHTPTVTVEKDTVQTVVPKVKVNPPRRDTSS